MNQAVSNQASAVAFTLTPEEGERFTIIGGGVRVLIDGAASAGQCCMFECPIPPGEGPPLHKHEREDELFLVLAGTIKFSIDGKAFIGERGSFACAPRGSVHAFRNIGSETAMLLVTCTPAGLEIPFRAVKDPEPDSGKTPMTPQQVAEEFAKHGITFVGPPLSA